MKKKFRIDGCMGCGVCADLASDCFEMDKDGLAEIRKDADGDIIADVKSSCPVSAIQEIVIPKE